MSDFFVSEGTAAEALRKTAVGMKQSTSVIFATVLARMTRLVSRSIACTIILILPACTALPRAEFTAREQQIADVQHDVHAEVDRGDNGSDLRLHRDGGEEEVVRAVERVDEKQHPEGQHRQEVTIDGPPGDRGDDEVRHTERAVSIRHVLGLRRGGSLLVLLIDLCPGQEQVKGFLLAKLVLQRVETTLLL